MPYRFERTISLEMPDKFARDWFLERFRLLMTDIMSESENLIRKYKPWYYNTRNTLPMDNKALDQIYVLKRLLIKGIEVVHHQFDGTITKSVFKYIESNGLIELKTSYVNMFGFVSYSYKRCKLLDIAELRPGTHSYGFVQTDFVSNHAETLSIISSECCMDLEFIDQRARDLFIHRFHMFLQLYSTSNDHDSIDDGMGTNSSSLEPTDSNEDPTTTLRDTTNETSSYINEYNFKAYLGMEDMQPIDFNDRTLLSSYNPLYRNGKRQQQVTLKNNSDGMIYNRKDLNNKQSIDNKDRKQENRMLQMYELYGRESKDDEELYEEETEMKFSSF